VGRYKGRINGWDVVNEALNEDGTMRQSQWQRIIGDDFIIKAFQFAHEADPKAELYYNDYNAEKDTKLKGVIEIVKKLKAAGVPITAVGMQDHEKMDWPSVAEHDAAIAAMKALGVKVAITELDIDLLPAVTRGPTADVNTRGQATANSNPYAAGLPDEMQQKLAKRYADLFAVYLKYKGTVTRVTFWGATDADSWLNGWPVPGRTAYPLLFDRQHKPKPAFDAVMKVAAGK
jgi:endo-1,4-beta-xylanase